VCESFVDNGECVEYCPPAYIYNEHTHRYEPNPDVKYEHSVLCVESCPGLITVYICPIAIASKSKSKSKNIYIAQKSHDT